MRRFLLLADRFEQAVQAVVVHPAHRAFELERDVVPGRDLAAVGIPARADVGVGAVDHRERGGAGDVPGQRVAAREVELDRAVPVETSGTCATRGPSGVCAKTVPKPISAISDFEQGAVLGAEQRIGMHQRLPPFGVLLGAPSVRVRRSPRRALR